MCTQSWNASYHSCPESTMVTQTELRTQNLTFRHWEGVFWSLADYFWNNLSVDLLEKWGLLLLFQKICSGLKILNIFGQIFLANLAQMVERLSYNLMVLSSNPFMGKFFFSLKLFSYDYDLSHCLKYIIILCNGKKVGANNLE